MVKHETYHIKDLKEFLKNEVCPYKQCRLSKVCNHIHCARENCFYVLHSSGQLLSHKRKHERMDNEQTYCRYKMLAVKAALLGNAAAATAARASSEPSVPLQKNLFDKDEELLKQSSLDQADMQKASVAVDIVHQSENPVSPVNNLTGDALQLTPSVIQQFFTIECSQSGASGEEPINLKNHSNEGVPPNQTTCPWKDRSEQHLHCILKDCKAAIPNNLVDISAHIRFHGFKFEGVCSRTVAPAMTEVVQYSEAGTSHSPMQITTIDGFCNRKRGRPPKNRFVEVYKNAIFTSFKLEKQTLPKDCNATCISTPSPSYTQPVGYHHIESHQRGQPAADDTTQKNPFPSQSPLTQGTSAAAVSPIASQFTIHKANEHCGEPGGRCPLAMQHHYHCACSADCTFVTVERDLLSVHLERQHTIPSFADVISKKFKHLDRNIELDCGISDCRLRKTRPHLHCRQCHLQISPFDLEIHVCGIPDQRSTSNAKSPTKKTPPTSLYSPTTEYRRHEPRMHTEVMGEHFLINSTKGHFRDYGRTSSVTLSTLTKLRRKVSKMEPEAGVGITRSHEDEKVLVVRAAGTYFPKSTTELSGSTSSQAQKKHLSSTSIYCSTPYCKMKRKPHKHCEYCDQSFIDSAKIKAHRLKHMPSTTKPDTEHLMSLHSTTEATEEPTHPSYLRPPSSNEARPSHTLTVYDDQPLDLSLSPNVPSNTQDERSNPNRDQFAASSSQIPPNSAGGGNFPNLFHPDLMSTISMQNLQLAQLGSLYQHNRHVPGSDEKPYFPAPNEWSKPTSLPPSVPPFPPAAAFGQSVSGQFPFLSPLLMAHASETTLTAIPPEGTGKPLKRKPANSIDDFSAFIDALSSSAKKQMQLPAAAATTASTSIRPNRPGCSGGSRGLPQDHQ